MNPAFANVLVMLTLASGAQAQTAAPLRIGLSAPLTGLDAAFGQGLKAGAEQAVADLNKAGGLKVVLVVADDGGDARQGVAATARLVAERVTAIVGPLSTAIAAGAMPVYQEAGIVVLTPATFAPLTTRGSWNVFRTAGSDAEQGAVAGTYLADRFRGRRIGLVHDKTTFGRSLVDDVARRLKAAGMSDAAFESLNRGDKDMAALAARLKRAQVDVVYFGGVAPEAALLVRAMREIGLAAPLMGSDGLLDKDFPQNAGPGAEGVLMTLAPEQPGRLPDSRGTTPKPARSPEAEMFAGQSYAAVEILKQAAEQAGSTDGRKIAAVLHGGASFKTVIGDIAYDANGDLRRPGYIVHVWKKTPDGRIDYAGNAIAP